MNYKKYGVFFFLASSVICSRFDIADYVQNRSWIRDSSRQLEILVGEYIAGDVSASDLEMSLVIHMRVKPRLLPFVIMSSNIDGESLLFSAHVYSLMEELMPTSLSFRNFGMIYRLLSHYSGIEYDSDDDSIYTRLRTQMKRLD